MSEERKRWLVVDRDCDIDVARSHEAALDVAEESGFNGWGPCTIIELDLSDLSGDTITATIVRGPKPEYWAQVTGLTNSNISRIGGKTFWLKSGFGFRDYIFYKANALGDPERITDEDEAREVYSRWQRGEL